MLNNVVERGERQRYAAQLQHRLAMESIGLIRTALHVQMPVFDALIGAKQHFDELPAGDDHQQLLRAKSFDLQLRMARTCIDFMHELDALAEEAVDLAAKEKQK